MHRLIGPPSLSLCVCVCVCHVTIRCLIGRRSFKCVRWSGQFGPIRRINSSCPRQRDSAYDIVHVCNFLFTLICVCVCVCWLSNPVGLTHKARDVRKPLNVARPVVRVAFGVIKVWRPAAGPLLHKKKLQFGGRLGQRWPVKYDPHVVF